MIRLFTVKRLINFVPIFLSIALLFTSFSIAQTTSIEEGENESSRFNNQIFLALSNATNSLSELEHNNRIGMSLVIDRNKLRMDKNLFPEDFQTWESEKHFWVGVGEIALLEFIPWALAKWIRHWEDPADNWANVSKETWWRNLSNGWEYDGDNFTTNNYAHPYHGALFFNVGRTNGYDFWESTAWSLTGSAIWEMFGETFRPAFNDWIYTGVGGAAYGEILYRLSSLITDNRATGTERFFSELWGTLLNPVRGFNRAISGEMGQNFDNPEWSRPKDFRLEFDAGTRTIDINGDGKYKENELEGLFMMSIKYGNPFKAKKPFEFFNFNVGFSSAIPHFAQLNSSGYLFGFDLKKHKHKFNVDLELRYNNLIREQTTETDTVYKGLVFGNTQIYPHILSNFPIGSKTSIITQVGINAVLMGATRNDYYVDVEGRIYDFGPGVGARLFGSLRSNGWDYLTVFYYATWIWTQSIPADSKHNIHLVSLEAQYPFSSFFSFGVRAGVFWRESYYDNFPDVSRNHPFVRVFFRTALINF